jgi:hypothetical protein
MLPVSCSKVSLNVLLPWSTCAITEKLRMRSKGTLCNKDWRTTSAMFVALAGIEFVGVEQSARITTAGSLGN